jgi:hypothetical protein
MTCGPTLVPRVVAGAELDRVPIFVGSDIHDMTQAVAERGD